MANDIFISICGDLFGTRGEGEGGRLNGARIYDPIVFISRHSREHTEENHNITYIIIIIIVMPHRVELLYSGRTIMHLEFRL